MEKIFERCNPEELPKNEKEVTLHKKEKQGLVI